MSSTPVVPRPGGASRNVLSERVLSHPGISVVQGERVVDLWTADGRCLGVRTESRFVAGRATVLATGGAAALWARTTNPRGAVGDGIALAYRAGAAVADLEFVQFHPTALVGSGFLLSEALRGAGALLVDNDGHRFTDELAPRDVVARAIGARGTAMLDLRPVDRGRFPTLMVSLEKVGYDPAAELIPVAPAAHYTMGGIVTDLDGRTELPGLYAAGECACTGVHGANRLASNSLLECLVFGRRAALAALGEPDLPARLGPPPVSGAGAVRGGHSCASPGALGGRRPRPRRRRPRAPARKAPSADQADRRERARPPREPGSAFPRRLSERGSRVRGPRRSPTRTAARAGAMVLEARPMELPAPELERVVREALAEDVGAGDVTTEATVDASATCEAQILLKQPGVVCGLVAAEAVFRTLDPDDPVRGARHGGRAGFGDPGRDRRESPAPRAQS